VTTLPVCLAVEGLSFSAIEKKWMINLQKKIFSTISRIYLLVHICALLEAKIVRTAMKTFWLELFVIKRVVTDTTGRQIFCFFVHKCHNW
jgi:hypothetical protein